MRSPNERHTGQFGRLILNRLSEKLSKHTKTREKDDPDGFVGNFSDGVVNFSVNDEFIRNRKFSSKDLQLLILALLANKPAHGYELIKALEVRSNGFYSPSPGMIYPALTHLGELEHITVTVDGNRQCYTLSATGQQFLAAHQHHVDAMWLKLVHVASKMDSAHSTHPEGTDGRLPDLADAKQFLKNAVNQCSDASIAEQRRIASILMQAAGAILGR